MGFDLRSFFSGKKKDSFDLSEFEPQRTPDTRINLPRPGEIRTFKPGQPNGVYESSEPKFDLSEFSQKPSSDFDLSEFSTGAVPKETPGFMSTFPTAVKTVTGAVSDKIKDWTGMEPVALRPDIRKPLIPVADMASKAIDYGSKLTGVDSKKYWDENFPKTSGYAEGAAELVGGLSTPENVGIMMAMGKLPKWLKDTPKVKNLINAVASGGFAYLMSKDLPEVYTQWKSAKESGNEREAARLQMLGFGQLAFATGAVAHAGGSVAEMSGAKVPVVRMGTPEELAHKTSLLMEKPEIGPDRMLPPPDPTAIGDGAIITPTPPAPVPLPPSRMLEGPPEVRGTDRMLLKGMTGKTPEQFRADSLAQENALKGVEMAVSEADLPSPTLVQALKSKYGETPAFSLPGRDVAVGAERLAMASNKLSRMLGLTPVNVTEAMIGAQRAYSESLSAGAIPEVAMASANAVFWSRVPVKYAMARMGIGKDPVAMNNFIEMLKSGDLDASRELMDSMMKSDPVLAAVFPEIKAEVMPAEPVVQRLKKEHVGGGFDPLEDIKRRGGFDPDYDPNGFGDLKALDMPSKYFTPGTKVGLDTLRESWASEGLISKDATLDDVRNAIADRLAGKKNESMQDTDFMDAQLNKPKPVEYMTPDELLDEMHQWTGIQAKEGKLYAAEQRRLSEIAEEMKQRRSYEKEQSQKKVEDEEFEKFSRDIELVQGKHDYVKNMKEGTPEENRESKYIADNYEEFSREYEKQFGNRLSSDAVKTMKFSDRKDFGSEDSLVRQKAAQAFIETKINSLLADTKQAEKPILVTAGITGAGKTTGLGMFGRGQNEYLFELDTNLANYDKAKATIEKFLRSSPTRQVDIVFTEREPFDAFKNGVMQRFFTTERRVVPIESHAYFMGAKDSVLKLHDNFGNYPRVEFRFRDNRGTAVAETSIDKIKNLVYNESEVRRKANELIQSEYSKGNLSDAEKSSFLGNEPDRANGRGNGPDVSRRNIEESKSLQPEQPQPEPPLNSKDLPPDGFKGPEWPPEAGATILLTEAAGRVLDLAKKAKNYAEFRRSVSEDVDLNDTVRFYSMNLRQMYDEQRQKQEAPPPPVTPKIKTAPIGGDGDKFAGNINLSKYKPEIQEGIKNLVQDHPELVERAKISDEQLTKMADALQATPTIDKLMKMPQAELAAEAEKYRRGYDAFVREMLKLNPSELEHAVGEIFSKNRTEEISKISYEFGRALSSLRRSVPEQEAMRKLFEDKIRQVEKDPSMSGASKEALVSQLRGQLKKVHDPTAFDMVYEYFLNNIFSNPTTHFYNVASNVGYTLMKPVQKAFAVLADLPASMITGKRTQFAGEIPEQIKGLIEAMKPKNEFKVMEGSKIDKVSALPKIMTLALEALKLEDNPFKRANGLMEAFGQAYAQAKREGLSGDALENRKNELVVFGPEQTKKFKIPGTNFEIPIEAKRREVKAGEPIRSRVEAEQLYRTFQQEMGTIGKAVSSFLHSVPALKFVQPVLRTAENIMKRYLEITPLNSVKIAYRTGQRVFKALPYPQEDISYDVGNFMLGSLIFAGVAKAVANKQILGSAPKNEKERAKFFQEGKKANSVRVGDKWVPYLRYGPAGSAISTMANVIQDWVDNKEKPNEEKIAAALFGITKSMKDQSFFSGLMNFTDTMSTQEKFVSSGKRLLSNIGSGFVPYSGSLRFMSNQTDSLLRKPNTISENIKSSIPVVSENVRPRLDQFGKAVERPSSFFERFLGIGTVPDDSIVKEMERLNYLIPVAPDRIQNQKLSPEQQDMYAKTFGPLLHDRLSNIVDKPIYKYMPDKAKMNLIDNVVEAAAKRAQRVILEDLGGTTYEKIKDSYGEKLRSIIQKTPKKLRGRLMSRLSEIQKESLRDREAVEIGDTRKAQ